MIVGVWIWVESVISVPDTVRKPTREPFRWFWQSTVCIQVMSACTIQDGGDREMVMENPLRGDNLAVFGMCRQAEVLESINLCFLPPFHLPCPRTTDNLHLLYLICRYTNNDLTWSCSLGLSVIRKTAARGQSFTLMVQPVCWRKKCFISFPFVCLKW